MATRLAGYLINTPGGALGTRGSAYTYILAENGVWLEAENSLLRARPLIAPAQVRGLLPLEPFLELQHGKISGHLLSLAMDTLSASPDLEGYAAIAWDGQGYRLVLPAQDRGQDQVSYESVPGTVVGIHSHGRMSAFFSGTDDEDDQGFLISVVAGHLEQLIPSARSRLCTYGYFCPIDPKEVFEGLLPWVERGEA